METLCNMCFLSLSHRLNMQLSLPEMSKRTLVKEDFYIDLNLISWFELWFVS